jgi:hypothetical protein
VPQPQPDAEALGDALGDCSNRGFEMRGCGWDLAAGDTAELPGGGAGTDWLPGIACPEAGEPVGTELDGESVGDGEPLPGELVDGVGVGDVGLTDGEPLGDELGDVDGVELGDVLGGAEPGLQLLDAVGDELPETPPEPSPYVVPPPVRGAEALVLEPPARIGWLSPADEMYCGSAAIAHDAPVTTSSPVASAAAGRIQPIQPAPRRSGRNRSATAP